MNGKILWHHLQNNSGSLQKETILAWASFKLVLTEYLIVNSIFQIQFQLQAVGQFKKYDDISMLLELLFLACLRRTSNS